jgi:hypothetical protein
MIVVHFLSFHAPSTPAPPRATAVFSPLDSQTLLCSSSYLDPLLAIQSPRRGTARWQAVPAGSWTRAVPVTGEGTWDASTALHPKLEMDTEEKQEEGH